MIRPNIALITSPSVVAATDELPGRCHREIVIMSMRHDASRVWFVQCTVHEPNETENEYHLHSPSFYASTVSTSSSSPFFVSSALASSIFSSTVSAWWHMCWRWQHFFRSRVVFGEDHSIPLSHAYTACMNESTKRNTVLSKSLFQIFICLVLNWYIYLSINRNTYNTNVSYYMLLLFSGWSKISSIYTRYPFM